MTFQLLNKEGSTGVADDDVLEEERIRHKFLFLLILIYKSMQTICTHNLSDNKHKFTHNQISFN